MSKKLYIECLTMRASDALIGLLKRKGYRFICADKYYGEIINFIQIDIENGFYYGSAKGDISHTWKKLDEYIWDELTNIPTIIEVYDNNKKSNGVIDDNMRQVSKDGRKMERFWCVRDGRSVPISSLKDDHLHNTILMVDRAIANGQCTIGYNRNLANLLDELEDERIHRGLHLPLMPYKSLDYRKGNRNV